jgi:hypothetical protein
MSVEKISQLMRGEKPFPNPLRLWVVVDRRESHVSICGGNIFG